MPLIILGEPLLGSETESPAPCMAPYGQFKLCLSVWNAYAESGNIITGLREEYLVIAYALKTQLQLDFRVAHIVKEGADADQALLAVLVNHLGCRLVGFPKDCCRELTVYPCDFGIELPGINLLNRRYGKLVSKNTKGEYSIVSPYGEGGRILYAGETVFVAERICRGKYSEPAKIKELKKVGLKVGLLPNLLTGSIDGKHLIRTTNDHLDRVSQMLLGRDGKPHLIVDPQYWSGPASNPTNPQKTIDKIKLFCEQLRVELHVPRGGGLRIPYALNFIQFPDGRVLMTSGDDPVAETIEGIIGRENLFLTEIPIVLYPVFRFAGIRCLIGRAPNVLFRKREEEPLEI